MNSTTIFASGEIETQNGGKRLRSDCMSLINQVGLTRGTGSGVTSKQGIKKGRLSEAAFS